MRKTLYKGQMFFSRKPSEVLLVVKTHQTVHSPQSRERRLNLRHASNSIEIALTIINTYGTINMLDQPPLFAYF